jgi:exodeoxyribonuclease VII small subunit
VKRKGTPSPPEEASGEARSFESMMDRLQELVDRLEEGNMPLEDSIRAYEEGMALVKSCTVVLNQAEQRIQKLTRDAAGKPVTEPFGGEDEEEGGGQLPF